MPESPNLQLEPCASAESSSFYLKYEIHLCIFCLSKIVSPAALSGLCTKMKIWKLTQKNLEFWYLLKIKWLENRKEQITTCNSKFFFVSLWYLYFLNPMSLKREAFKFAIKELSTFSGASKTLFGQYCLQLKRLPRSYCHWNRKNNPDEKDKKRKCFLLVLPQIQLINAWGSSRDNLC